MLTITPATQAPAKSITIDKGALDRVPMIDLLKFCAAHGLVMRATTSGLRIKQSETNK